MTALDSIYAMLARPVTATFEQRRRVNPLENNTAIDKDCHEPPQSQLPSELPKSGFNPQYQPHQPPQLKPRESVNKPLVERRSRRVGSHIDIEV